MSTFDDPNREAVGLPPIWTGANLPGDEEPPPQEPPEEPPAEEPTTTSTKASPSS